MNSLRSSRGGILSFLLWTLALCALALVITWVFFLPRIVERVIESRTGFHLKIDRLSVNPFGVHFETAGLVLSNPQTFPNPSFVKINSIVATLPLSSLWSDTFVVDNAVLDVEEVGIIRAQNGTTNAQVFADRLLGARSSEPTKTSVSTATGPSKPFLIHRLEIGANRVIVENYTSKDPLKKSFDLKFHQTWSEVNSVRSLLTVNVLKALAPVASAMNGNLPPSLQKAFNSISSGGQNLLKMLGNDFFKSSGDSLEENQKP